MGGLFHAFFRSYCTNLYPARWQRGLVHDSSDKTDKRDRQGLPRTRICRKGTVHFTAASFPTCFVVYLSERGDLLFRDFPTLGSGQIESRKAQFRDLPNRAPAGNQISVPQRNLPEKRLIQFQVSRCVFLRSSQKIIASETRNKRYSAKREKDNSARN